MHHLLTLVRMWHKGSSTAGQEEVWTAITHTMACLEALSALVGQSAHFPKAHDLLHIAHDIRKFGSSSNYSTGAFEFVMAVPYGNPIWQYYMAISDCHNILPAPFCQHCSFNMSLQHVVLV